MSNSLNLDQAQHFVRPDLGPNCLQMLSADNTSRQKIKATININVHSGITGLNFGLESSFSIICI